MPRTSPTHQATLDCADRLWAQQVWPTPTLVRAHLGTGSYSTVCKALAQWRKTRGLDAPGMRPSPPPVSAHPPTLLGTAPPATELPLAELTEELARAVVRLLPAAAPAPSSAGDPAKVAKDAVEALQSMQARLDAVQKHMLMSIEHARSEAAQWRQRVQEIKEELGTWRSTYQQRHDADQREIRMLRETLEQLKAQKG